MKIRYGPGLAELFSKVPHGPRSPPGWVRLEDVPSFPIARSGFWGGDDADHWRLAVSLELGVPAQWSGSVKFGLPMIPTWAALSFSFFCMANERTAATHLLKFFRDHERERKAFEVAHALGHIKNADDMRAMLHELAFSDD